MQWDCGDGRVQCKGKGKRKDVGKGREQRKGLCQGHGREGRVRKDVSKCRV